MSIEGTGALENCKALVKKTPVRVSWGNDLMNADDVLETNGSLNDIPDTHPVYEDRSFGGAGLDILIGNTGGDRLMDWAGEFNSYIVPFSPFGIATVSRQPSTPIAVCSPTAAAGSRWRRRRSAATR